MQNNLDFASPVKVFTKEKLDMKACNCLICGKRGGKEGYRSRKKRELQHL